MEKEMKRMEKGDMGAEKITIHFREERAATQIEASMA